jgi:hypothetical protein
MSMELPDMESNGLCALFIAKQFVSILDMRSKLVNIGLRKIKLVNNTHDAVSCVLKKFYALIFVDLDFKVQELDGLVRAIRSGTPRNQYGASYIVGYKNNDDGAKAEQVEMDCKLITSEASMQVLKEIVRVVS